MAAGGTKGPERRSAGSWPRLKAVTSCGCATISDGGVGDLKHQVREVVATCIQVDLGMQWPAAGGSVAEGAGRLPLDAVSSSAAPTRYVESRVLVPLQAHRIEGLEVQKIVVVGGRATSGAVPTIGSC